MIRETWYVLEDGTAVHPREVAPNKDGRLAHKSGLVAMRADGETPLSRGVDVDDSPGGAKPMGKSPIQEATESLAPVAIASEALKKKTEDMQPQETYATAKNPGYKTRGK